MTARSADVDPPEPDTREHRRLRATWWTLGGGLAAGVLAMALVAGVGGSGRVGLGVLLLVNAAGSVVAALVTAVLAMVDEYRRVPAGPRRAVVAVGLFVLAGVLLFMSIGVMAG